MTLAVCNTKYIDRLAPEMDKRLVDRARRAAARLGWRIEKQRGMALSYRRGGLKLLDENDKVIAGALFELLPADVIALTRAAEAEKELEELRARALFYGFRIIRRGRDKFWLINNHECTADHLRQMLRHMDVFDEAHHAERTQRTAVRRRVNSRR